MEIFKVTSTSAIQHWLNPLKISRVTLTPESTSTLPGDPPIIVTEPATLVIHLDDGFAIQVPDDVAALIDKLDKVG